MLLFKYVYPFKISLILSNDFLTLLDSWSIDCEISIQTLLLSFTELLCWTTTALITLLLTLPSPSNSTASRSSLGSSVSKTTQLGTQSPNFKVTKLLQFAWFAGQACRWLRLWSQIVNLSRGKSTLIHPASKRLHYRNRCWVKCKIEKRPDNFP